MSKAPLQLALDFGPREAQASVAKAGHLAYRLSRELGVPVRLAVTDNRSTMVSFRRAASALRLRVHHMFLDAPEPVVQAIADYAGRGRSTAGAVLDEFIRHRQPLIRQEVRGTAPLNPTGRHYDLRAVYERVNQTYFGDTIAARIGWGRLPSRRRRKSIRLGVYDHQTREIRIHPALDREDVPEFFVEFIVFHEMLHQLYPSELRPGARRVHHSRAFREHERAFPYYHLAILWERRNLSLLLRR